MAKHQHKFHCLLWLLLCWRQVTRLGLIVLLFVVTVDSKSQLWDWLFYCLLWLLTASHHYVLLFVVTVDSKSPLWDWLFYCLLWLLTASHHYVLLLFVTVDSKSPLWDLLLLFVVTVVELTRLLWLLTASHHCGINCSLVCCDCWQQATTVGLIVLLSVVTVDSKQPAQEYTSSWRIPAAMEHLSTGRKWVSALVYEWMSECCGWIHHLDEWVFWVSILC